MKRIITLLLASTMIFAATGCDIEDESTNSNLTEFANFKLLESKSSFASYDEEIYVDLNTGVLYYVQELTHQKSMTAIMEADGTPLTLEEFNERHSSKGE